MKEVEVIFLDVEGQNAIDNLFETFSAMAPQFVPESVRAYFPYTIEKCEDFKKTQYNQTLVALRKLKNLYKWTDPEEMVDYVKVLKEVEHCGANQRMDGLKQCQLEDSDVKLVLKIWEKVVKDGNLPPQDIEIFVNIIEKFKYCKGSSHTKPTKQMFNPKIRQEVGM